MTKRRSIDWEAIHRDYRTGHFTLRELEAKYSVDNATIARKVKRDGWKQDLTDVVRQATNARLISEMVSSEVSNAQQEVSKTVFAAAEANTKLIMGHRAKLATLHELTVEAQMKLVELGQSLKDVREAGAFVQAVNTLAATTKTLIEQERKAFGLDDAGKGDSEYEDLLRRVAEE